MEGQALQSPPCLVPCSGEEGLALSSPCLWGTLIHRSLFLPLACCVFLSLQNRVMPPTLWRG